MRVPCGNLCVSGITGWGRASSSLLFCNSVAWLGDSVPSCLVPAEWKAWVGDSLIRPYLKQQQASPMSCSRHAALCSRQACPSLLAPCATIVQTAGRWQTVRPRCLQATAPHSLHPPLAHKSPAGQHGRRQQPHQRQPCASSTAVQLLPRRSQRARCQPDHRLPAAQVRLLRLLKLLRQDGCCSLRPVGSALAL